MVQVSTAEGHCPGPAPQHLALRTGVCPGTASGTTAADATQAGVVPDLSHGPSHPLEDVSPEPVPTTAWLFEHCMDRAPGGITTPHLHSRGG